MVQIGQKPRADSAATQAPKTKATALAAQKAGYSASNSSSSQQLKDRLLLSLSGGAPQNSRRKPETARGAAPDHISSVVKTANGSQSAREPVKTIIAYTKDGNADPVVTVVGAEDVRAALAGKSVRLARSRSKESFEGAYSVADERHPKTKAPLPFQSILKTSKTRKITKTPVKQGAHLHKKVAFGGSGGEQVTIYFYVATEVNLPWNGPRPIGKMGSKERTGMALRKQEQALSFRM